MVLTFEVPGPPVPKERARRGRNGRFYTPERTQRYEGTVARSALYEVQRRRVRGEGDWPMDGRYRVSVDLYMPDARRRDADNALKSVLDGLNRAAWRDDSQVVVIECRKLIDRDKPRAAVRIEVLT